MNWDVGCLLALFAIVCFMLYVILGILEKDEDE